MYNGETWDDFLKEIRLIGYSKKLSMPRENGKIALKSGKKKDKNKNKNLPIQDALLYPIKEALLRSECKIKTFQDKQKWDVNPTGWFCKWYLRSSYIETKKGNQHHKRI